MRTKFPPKRVFKLVYPHNDWECKECGKTTKGRHYRPKESAEPCVFRNLFMSGRQPDRYCVPCAEKLALTIRAAEEKVG